MDLERDKAMKRPDSGLPELTPLAEHLLFVALLLPTFIVLAAAAVSLTASEPSVAARPVAQTAAVCEPCPAAEPADMP